MNTKTFLALAGLLIIALLASASVYTIKESERGVLLKFGRVVNDDLKPGLHFKIPIVEEVRRFDARVIALDIPVAEYLTLEKKRLVVDSFVMWRILDTPATDEEESGLSKYYVSTQGGLQANALLTPRVNEGLRNKFGERSVQEVVSGEREELMREITEEMNALTSSEFGIEVLDVRVRKIELPPSVSSNVYDRMRAERQREAQEHRSEGNEKAEAIRADADRQRRVVLANAEKESEKIRGEGDAIAAETYAAAYNQDAEFYNFYRSLEAYREAFSGKEDMMVLEPDSEFFNYLKAPVQAR